MALGFVIESNGSVDLSDFESLNLVEQYRLDEICGDFHCVSENLDGIDEYFGTFSFSNSKKYIERTKVIEGKHISNIYDKHGRLKGREMFGDFKNVIDRLPEFTA